MKKLFYITSFTLLGLLVATLVHAGLEIPTLHIITNNMDRHADGVVWRNWRLIHGFVGATLWILGAGVGLWLGFRFWHILYVEKRYGEKKW